MPAPEDALPYLALSESPHPVGWDARETVAAITELAARCADRHRPVVDLDDHRLMDPSLTGGWFIT